MSPLLLILSWARAIQLVVVLFTFSRTMHRIDMMDATATQFQSIAEKLVAEALQERINSYSAQEGINSKGSIIDM